MYAISERKLQQKNSDRVQVYPNNLTQQLVQDRLDEYRILASSHHYKYLLSMSKLYWVVGLVEKFEQYCSIILEKEGVSL